MLSEREAGMVGPGYSSNGCYQHSLCASCAQIGLDILTSNWPSWKSDDLLFIMGVPTGPIEEVMIFVVSLGVPTDSRGEVMKFGVSWGVPTDLGGWVGQFEEVLIFHTRYGPFRLSIANILYSSQTCLNSSLCLYRKFASVILKYSLWFLWSLVQPS